MNIIYDAQLAAGATEWYGSIVVSNLRYEDGSRITVNQYLAIDFSSPAAIDGKAVLPQFTQWVTGDITATSVSIGDGSYDIDVTMPFTTSYTLQPTDQISFDINGDLTTDTSRWLDSFVFAADAAPAIYGTVDIACAALPDPALANVAPTLTFTRGSTADVITLAYGGTTSSQLQEGSYAITAAELSNDAETVVAAPAVDPAQLGVSSGQELAVSVTFPAVAYYSALDLSIDALAGLSNEQLSVTVTDAASRTTLAAFQTTTDSVTSLRRLPPSGTARISIAPIALNNVNYTFQIADVTLDGTLQDVQVSDSNVTRSPVDTTGFATVAIDVEVTQPVNDSLLLRLTGNGMSYTQTVGTSSQQTRFDVPVRPDTYTVAAPDFLDGGTVYSVTVPAQLTVPASGGATLSVSIETSANLMVRGFPDYLSFGGCSDLTPGNRADFVSARASSVFSYAGTDGAGDSGVFLTDDPQTRAIIQMARDVEADLGNTQPVLPVIISYTCNLSLGDTPTILANADAHTHSFANYILALNIATSQIDAEHPVPAGFIVNPDFLGACQQGNYGADYAMPVIQPLKDALAHWNLTLTVPSSITDTIAGYVQAVNWLTRAVAPSVTFGWQINLWGVGYSEWIYDDTDVDTMATQTADYVTSLGVYDATYKPDFLAIDRYEADDFTQRAYANGYCYGPREWSRYFDFCRTVSRALKLPVMPWQIPASRTPVTTDPVNDDFDSQHWGTGGSCLLGDAAVGSDYHHVHPTILALQFPAAFQQYMGATAEDSFIRSEPFDITDPSYGDFPLRGIFAVLLGGGATTGIVASIGNGEPWARDRLNAYMQSPIGFDGTTPTSRSRRVVRAVVHA